MGVTTGSVKKLRNNCSRADVQTTFSTRSIATTLIVAAGQDSFAPSIARESTAHPRLRADRLSSGDARARYESQGARPAFGLSRVEGAINASTSSDRGDSNGLRVAPALRCRSARGSCFFSSRPVSHP